MNNIKLEIELQTPEAKSDILELYKFLKGEVTGLKIELKENPREGTMGVDNELILAFSSAIAVEGLKKLFFALKDYFLLHVQKYSVYKDKNEVAITKKTKEGNLETFKFRLFNEEEEKLFEEMLMK